MDRVILNRVTVLRVTVCRVTVFRINPNGRVKFQPFSAEVLYPINEFDVPKEYLYNQSRSANVEQLIFCKGVFG